MHSERVLMIRLRTWVDCDDEIELGNYRSGIGYREGISLIELVDSMRAWWRINPTRVEWEGIEHAVAVYQGITRAVVEIGDWMQVPNGRWGFTATPITDGPVYNKWVGPSGHQIHFRRGNQSPVLYWPLR